MTPPGSMDDLVRHLSKDEMDKLKQVVAERQAAQAESMEENTMA